MNGNLVYFLSDGYKVKIGFTQNLMQRIEKLQSGNPNKLKVLKIIKFKTLQQANKAEDLLHIKYDHLRIKTHRSEWFRYTDDYLEEKEENIFKPRNNNHQELVQTIYGDDFELFPINERPSCFFYPELPAHILNSKVKSQKNTVPYRTMSYPTYGKQMLLPFSTAYDRVFISQRKHKQNMEMHRFISEKNNSEGLEKFTTNDDSVGSLLNFF